MKEKEILEFWEIRARQNRIFGSWGDSGGKLENNLSQTGYNHKVCKYAERIIQLWELVAREMGLGSVALQICSV